MPLEFVVQRRPRPNLKVALNSSAESKIASSTRSRGDEPASPGWPGTSSRNAKQLAGDLGDSDESAPEDFVWPSRARSNSANDNRAARPSLGGGTGGKSDRGDTDPLAAGSATSGPPGPASVANKGSESVLGGVAAPSIGADNGSLQRVPLGQVDTPLVVWARTLDAAVDRGRVRCGSGPSAKTSRQLGRMSRLRQSQARLGLPQDL